MPYCTWEFARLGMCGNASFGRNGPLTSFDIFLMFVVLIFPLCAAFLAGRIAGYRDARQVNALLDEAHPLYPLVDYEGVMPAPAIF